MSDDVSYSSNIQNLSRSYLLHFVQLSLHVSFKEEFNAQRKIINRTMNDTIANDEEKKAMIPINKLNKNKLFIKYSYINNITYLSCKCNNLFY